jgi:DNA modification methylase
MTTGRILDPYMGSATTLIAALQLGRQAVGIEVSPKYCNAAIARLKQIIEEAGHDTDSHQQQKRKA